MHLRNNLYTVYGELLVPAGVDVTPPIVRKVRAMGESHPQVRVPLRNTSVFRDFQDIFDDERYETMLRPPVTKKEICDVAGRLRIENDIIFELNNMKVNLPYTYKHVMVVAAFSIKFALIQKKSRAEQEVITHCGFTHDIGKTRIPIKILNKEGKLTGEERATIETHPLAGYLLLNYYLKSDRSACALASLEHHEKLDGSGYPNGIRKISIYTRLISAIDIMDALLTPRPYRKKAFTRRAALDYLVKEATAGRLDRKVVLTLIRYARTDRPDTAKLRVGRDEEARLLEELAEEKYL